MVGYIGSFPIPEVVMGINAFTLAAQKINPSIQTKVVWVNSWYDPGKEGDAAKTLIDQGADIIVQHTDSAAAAAGGRGARRVRLRPGLRHDAFAPKAQLTAIVDNWGPYYIARTQAVLDGTWKSQNIWHGPQGRHGRDRPVRARRCRPRSPRPRTRSRTRSSPARCHPFTGPILDQSGAERVGSGLTIPDEDLAKMDWYVKGVQA